MTIVFKDDDNKARGIAPVHSRINNAKRRRRSRRQEHALKSLARCSVYQPGGIDARVVVLQVR